MRFFRAHVFCFGPPRKSAMNRYWIRTLAAFPVLALVLLGRVVATQDARNPGAAALRNPVAATPESLGAGKKQMVVVTDHDSKVIARRVFRCRAWDLGVALDWAAGRAAAKGWAGVTVAFETGAFQPFGVIVTCSGCARLNGPFASLPGSDTLSAASAAVEITFAVVWAV